MCNIKELNNLITISAIENPRDAYVSLKKHFFVKIPEMLMYP